MSVAKIKAKPKPVKPVQMTMNGIQKKFHVHPGTSVVGYAHLPTTRTKM